VAAFLASVHLNGIEIKVSAAIRLMPMPTSIMTEVELPDSKAFGENLWVVRGVTSSLVTPAVQQVEHGEFL